MREALATTNINRGHLTNLSILSTSASSHSNNPARYKQASKQASKATHIINLHLLLYATRLKTITPTTIIMRSFITVFSAAMVAASPAVNPGTGSGTAPDPSQIQIVSVSASGNGCPQGSVTTDLSPDRQVSQLLK
jgi:hypothetical protein